MVRSGRKVFPKPRAFREFRPKTLRMNGGTRVALLTGKRELPRTIMIPIELDPSSPATLQMQVWEKIRAAIVAGVLRPGAQLPSSREIARELGVSRNTIIHALEKLADEGYLRMRVGSGTFVADPLPDDCVGAAQKTSSGRTKHSATEPPPVPARDVRHPPVLLKAEALQMVRSGIGDHQIDFRYCSANWRNFPLREWRQFMTENISRASANISSYSAPEGLSELRRAIADHVSANRAIAIDPDQVIVTAGAQEALNLISRLFVQPSVKVAVESPCYRGAAYAFQSYGSELVPLSIDEEGAQVAALDGSAASLIYVTPSHQFPTGVTMSPRRRSELLAWAERNAAYIIEDDYDSDFRYDGPPLPALAGLNGNTSVIYLGTFSKSVGSGLRTGYAIVPRQLIEPMRRVKALANCGQPWIEQAVLAEFITRGAFERHLRRLRQTYGRTRAGLLEAIETHFGQADISGAAGGMHVMWALPSHFPTANEVAAIAAAEGVGIYTVSKAGAFEFDPQNSSRQIVLGYSLLTPEAAREGVARIARGLKRCAVQMSIPSIAGEAWRAHDRLPARAL
jgi:GntR family transcriptional regulator/MocR family aminotransferase